MNEVQHYNDKANFAEVIKPLELRFTELSGPQRQSYYETLSGVDRDLMKKAVRILLSNHSYQRFPLEYEIRDAIKKADEKLNKTKANEFDRLKKTSECLSCNATGYTFYEKKYDNAEQTYTTARYCVCPVGQYLKDTVKWDKAR